MRDTWKMLFYFAMAALLVLSPACQAGGGKPRVSISSPADGAVFTEGSQVTIVAGAVGGGMIERVELSVDGSAYESADNPHVSVAMQAKFTWQATGAGTHTLQVTAYNRDGVASDPASIRVQVQ